MKKYELLPNVVVYKGMYKDVNNMFELIKDSENLEKSLYIGSWGPWATFGKIAKTLKTKFDNEIIEGEIASKQKEIIKEIFDVYKAVSQDYLDNYKDKVEWPSFVSNFNLSQADWVNGDADMLKYNLTEGNIALHYHVDQNQWKMASAGTKFILTITSYINDDYDGGEISFLNDSTNQIFTYKPEAGDITIFPSFYPYFHGVLPITQGNKYLLRMFYLWYYKGDDEWLAKKEQYGEEELRRLDDLEIENKNILAKQKIYDTNSPDYSYDPNIRMPLSNLEKYNIIYIDGKDLK